MLRQKPAAVRVQVLLMWSAFDGRCTRTRESASVRARRAPWKRVMRTTGARFNGQGSLAEKRATAPALPRVAGESRAALQSNNVEALTLHTCRPAVQGRKHGPQVSHQQGCPRKQQQTRILQQSSTSIQKRFSSRSNKLQHLTLFMLVFPVLMRSIHFGHFITELFTLWYF